MWIRKIIAAAFTACIVLTFVPTISNADYTGWYLGRYGWMYYTVEDGFITESWKQINGVWYYFSSYGYMVHDATGLEIDGKLYDFNDYGVCMNPNNPRKD